ncbi:hypothetical protein DEJ16_12620 [Curtobacterium sp. MCJR17_055]|uniref:hypothetical protein n=1 Tax=unclassified Curtobacterium TaxID=257496 RepID=UPI000D9893BB|nr:MULTISPECIES: hypothetical protein [unclassified Curtobacterium]PYY34093.1 hypothetical protein DEI87_10045 [Curtobacterium sp. MCBD17_029]PYY53943.1 hypothetical protein DEJ16_12620 [Curtobacterium sp. MCJR17_055]PYY59170.1 hypothetical protein DEJ26_09195 [Curtobacterium sp. MCPF17_015]WIB34809.1 hypothetical protein DEJ15_09525 [Curtobacterium sp. MCJR17_043]
MPRYTPLYGLPALAPTERARDIADVDWDNALLVEAILAKRGAVPLGADLQGLLKRLTPYSFRASARESVAINGVTQIGESMLYRSGDNIGSTAWDDGVLTMPPGSGGEYLVSVSIRNTTGGRVWLTKNGTSDDTRFGFQDGLNAVSTLTVSLDAGDTLRPWATSSAASLSDSTGTVFTVRRLVV